jgi:WhiB family transcriptional regulator, redox-sensing transcriptional regulator
MFAIQAIEETETIREPVWQDLALCNDGSGGSMTELFFSEQLDDIAAAKAFCLECPVRDNCLDGALTRREPWGVWGGELFVNGRVVANKRRRGRPPKVARVEPTLSWEIAVADIA